MWLCSVFEVFYDLKNLESLKQVLILHRRILYLKNVLNISSIFFFLIFFRLCLPKWTSSTSIETYGSMSWSSASFPNVRLCRFWKSVGRKPIASQTFICNLPVNIMEKGELFAAFFFLFILLLASCSYN